jgi:hypothetical protein
MRACLTSALAIAAVVLSFGSAWAQNGCNTCGSAGGYDAACGGGACGNGGGSRCGAHGCRLHHHHKYIDGLDYGFNCGCNGSYNYPVPPLYTYHWPGMYKAVRMTDYHSPWRFPPLRPYVDEVAVPATMTSEGSVSELQPITALMPIAGAKSEFGQPESMSSKLLRSIR